MENEKDYTEIDLVEVFYVIKDNARNIFVVTLCCVLIAAAYLFLHSKTPTYTSEALIRFRQMPNLVLTNDNPIKEIDSLKSVGAESYVSVLTVSSSGLNVNQRMQNYAELSKSSALLAAVNKEIAASGTVQASPIKDSEMLKLSFSTSNAEKAQKGNELLIKKLQAYVSEKGHSETRYVFSENLDAVKSEEKPAAEAIVREQTVVEVINPPSFPRTTAQNKKRTLAVSALLGILLGSGYAVMHYLMNRKITTRQDVEDYLGLPVLAVVPEEKSLAEAMARKNDQSVLQKIGGLLWKEQN